MCMYIRKSFLYWCPLTFTRCGNVHPNLIFLAFCTLTSKFLTDHYKLVTSIKCLDGNWHVHSTWLTIIRVWVISRFLFLYFFSLHNFLLSPLKKSIFLFLFFFPLKQNLEQIFVLKGQSALGQRAAWGQRERGFSNPGEQSLSVISTWRSSLRAVEAGGMGALAIWGVGFINDLESGLEQCGSMRSGVVQGSQVVVRWHGSKGSGSSAI